MQKFILAALLFVLFSVKCAAQIVPTPGLKITAATVFKPGTYRTSETTGDFLAASGANFTLDLKNVRLAGPGKGNGVGLHITDAHNLTIKNAALTGFQWGIVLERCENVRLLNCRAVFNGDLPPGTVIDESGRGPEDTHGGGILLRDCRKCFLQNAQSSYQWDGLDVVRSEDNVIDSCDFSYNNNWGIHFWNSSRNTFRDSRAVWCTTGAGRLYQALTGWQTYDAQAVAIDHNSNENVISGNDLRFSGDGIFIRANEGPITPGTAVPVRNASNRNVLRDNDCAFSPNNAIEADFVEGTIIEGNNVSNSHYGMWLGYSQGSVVKANIGINDSANVVEIENGQGAVFENNVFGYDDYREGGQAILLRQNGRDKTPSRNYKIQHNTFFGVKNPVALQDTEAVVAENDLLPPGSPTPNGWGFGNGIALPGATITLPALITGLSYGPPALEINGVPLWMRRGGKGFQIPADFSPAPGLNSHFLSALTREGWRPIRLLRLTAGPKAALAFHAALPERLLSGEKVTVEGANLQGGRILVNGLPVKLLEARATRMVFLLPDSLKPGMGVNVLWERGERLDYERRFPIVLTEKAPVKK